MKQVLIYPGEDGYWVVECPSLPGCISQGKSREEAVVNIKEAIEGYIEALACGSMSKLPRVSGPETAAALKKLGFYI